MAAEVRFVAERSAAETSNEDGLVTEGAFRRKRGPYKLYSFNPEDESYSAKIPKTTKWRRRQRDRDAASSKQNLGDQTSIAEQDEDLQSPCSSPSFSMGNEDYDFSGRNCIKHRQMHANI